MNLPARIIALAAAGSAVFALVPALAPARAAAVRGPILACRDKGDIMKALQRGSDKQGKEIASFLDGRVKSGDCLQLRTDQKVEVDQRDGVLWCVRPAGGLDCFWTLDKAIDLYPPAPQVPGEAPARGKKH